MMIHHLRCSPPLEAPAPMFSSSPCKISTTTTAATLIIPSWPPPPSDHTPHRRFPKPALSSLKFTRCSLGIRDTLRRTEAGDAKSDLRIPVKSDEDGEKEGVGATEEEAEVEEEEKGVSGIDVPRQRYISVSKSELLKKIVLMFDSQEERDQFLLLSECLDSILHAEHKSILEEMRMDYDLTHIMEKKEPGHDSSEDSEIVASANISGSTVENEFWNESPKEHTEDKIGSGCPLANRPDLRYLLGFPLENVKKDSLNKSRVAVATRFQRAFVKLLYDAQFEELSARDLMLTSTLNSDYLLTLPIYVDWKRASESNAIIFRRGYATEKQKGLLIVEKLDYLQSKLLQGIFFNISKPLGKFLSWMIEAFRNAIQGQDSQVWAEKAKVWLTERIILQQSYSYSEQTSDNLLKDDQLSDNDLPIWLAAQSAITRYEGILSQVGPRRRLLRKLFTWIGLLPPIPREQSDIETDASSSEHYLRPIFLSRRTLSDIWEPATKNRCGNDFWKMLKTSFSILFSRAVLQEPTFQELILLFTEERGSEETEDTNEAPSLQLKIKIFENISIPDLPVIFPHKKLSFRILDTVRLDIATVLGLWHSSSTTNLKTSHHHRKSAIYLDAIAVSALILSVTRVTLGYKQTWDRYQLLVNKTLYEKTLASGFGTVHFLLDASEQQQYKEAILAYAVLLKAKTSQVTCPQYIKDKCERFVYNSFKEKVEMPVDKAMDTLIRLGLVVEKVVNKIITLQAVPCHEACDILKRRWHSMIPNSTSI